MFVKDIVWFSQEIKEGIIIITDGEFELQCFSCPVELSINETVNRPLCCLDVYNVVVSNEKSFYIKQKEYNFEYFVRGQLVDKKNRIVKIGQIEISFKKDIPNDIQENQYIEFDVLRFDIY